ncbi:MAG: valine--tRNA ligase [Planctomycetales bacterium]|nr:valine--tRNA ligase [Planctomycetales bacterium]
MTTEIPKQYDPAAAEAKWLPFWEERGDFNADPDPSKPPHVIMIPLPNVTGALHMGHALNGTLQDLLTRWRRMQGYEALWMPGTDHAGIATQAMVEKRMLAEEGLTRRDIGREALIERIWKWKDEYEARILSQLKRIGASCDWRRVRFTLDEVCSRAVRQTFFKMFQDGLIFRGKRLVNWDCFLQTAVADDEVYEEETDGHFWTFNYPIVDDAGQLTGERISFSTTRPETMLGDTAVCVHPTDERYMHLIGKHVRIPVNGRVIPIVADALLADKTLGTGCVKVTPAHDPNDYACWTRNKEQMGEPINLLNPDGTLNENAGPWQGQDRLVARDAVVAEMERLGHFEKVEDRKIPLKHSDRSKTPVEPYLSEQWFVKMSDWEDGRPGLAQTAIDAANDGRVTFYPERYKQSYLSWLGEKRDWCISRQLWWGHRIPVWTVNVREDQSEVAHSLLKQFLNDADIADDVCVLDVGDELLGICARSPAAERALRAVEEYCEMLRPAAQTRYGLTPPTLPERIWELPKAKLAADELFDAGLYLTQDPDVLDTWFSSALWPHATLGWPDTEHNPPLTPPGSPSTNSDISTKNEVLPYFYPGSVLVTSRDIITLWVARMVLTGLYNMGDVPFKHVCIHPKIQDGFGQTMSKSKGNGVDPIELIEKYGCDGMRFTIASFAGETQDVRLPVGYECPHCQAVIPQEPHHLKFKPGKPKVKCAKCKKDSQYATPNYTPDDGEPVARITIERFEYGRNFCNKLWNAARFAMLNLEGYSAGPVSDSELAIEDRWILSRLATVTDEVTSLLDLYKFDAATRTLREFVWNEFCDWYLEMIKPRLRDEALKPAAQRVLVAVLDTTLRLLHPFTPFITEELWQRLNEIAPSRGLPTPTPAADAVIIAPWPGQRSPVAPRQEARTPDSSLHVETLANAGQSSRFDSRSETATLSGLEAWRDSALEARFQRLQDLIVAVRNVRGTYNISPALTVTISIRCSPEVAADLEQVQSQFENLAKATLTATGPNVARPKASVSFSLGNSDGFLPLDGLVDLATERQRQQKEADKLRGFIGGTEKKLSNESFVAKAPAEVVAEIRQTLLNQQKQLASIEEIVKQLSVD